jgi:hypothetical protein
MLDRLDPSRGDRIEDNPEIEELYRRVVEVQPEIVGLMKKYSDQKGKRPLPSGYIGEAYVSNFSGTGAYPPGICEGSATIYQDDPASAGSTWIPNGLHRTSAR